MRQALYQSRNVPTVRLSQEVGLSRISRVAANMGMGNIPSNPSVVLGTFEVTPLQLTQSFAAFATLGTRPEARFVTNITDRDGGTVWSQAPQTDRVVDPAVAFLTTNILQDVVGRGTGTAVRAAGFRGAAAGKTGTTNEEKDAWFVGYSPDLVVGDEILWDVRPGARPPSGRQRPGLEQSPLANLTLKCYRLFTAALYKRLELVSLVPTPKR